MRESKTKRRLCSSMSKGERRGSREENRQRSRGQQESRERKGNGAGDRDAGDRRGETRRGGFPARRSQFRPGIYPINFRSVEWQRARRGSRLAVRYINAAELAASPPGGLAPKCPAPSAHPELTIFVYVCVRVYVCVCVCVCARARRILRRIL